MACGPRPPECVHWYAAKDSVLKMTDASRHRATEDSCWGPMVHAASGRRPSRSFVRSQVHVLLRPRLQGQNVLRLMASASANKQCAPRSLLKDKNSWHSEDADISW